MSQYTLQLFETPIRFLQNAGIWINDDKTKNQNRVKLFLNLALKVNLILMEIMYLVHAKNLEDFSEAVAIFPTMIGSFFKTVNFVYNKQKIEKCLQDLKELIESDHWMDNQKGVKLLRRINFIKNILKVIIVSAGVSYFLSLSVPIFNHEIPYKLWFPYDYRRNEIIFWATVAFEFFQGCIIAPVSIIVDIFPLFLISFLIGITEELSERLKLIEGKPKSQRKKLRNHEKKDEHLQELVKCIKIHLKVKNLAADVSDIFGKVIWMEGLLSVVLLCTASFTLTVVGKTFVYFSI